MEQELSYHSISDQLLKNNDSENKHIFKINLVPYRQNESWLFYKIKEKIISDQSFTIMNMIEIELLGHVYLCINNDYKLNRNNTASYFIIDLEGRKYNLGVFKGLRRSEDYFLGYSDDEKYHLFYKEKMICKIPSIDKSAYLPNFEVIEDEYIHFYKSTNNEKKFTISIFNFYGEKLNTSINKHEIKNDIKTKNISDTYWIEKNNCLYFKDKLILKCSDIDEHIEISSFYLGFAFVRIVLMVGDGNGDYAIIEFKEIGYIDIYGNKYWN